MLTHFEDGKAVMVDVSEKASSAREAQAQARVRLDTPALTALEQGGVGKGDPIAVAELAGIMAAKRCSDLIPLCHNIPLSSVKVHGELQGDAVVFVSICKTQASTGVEMEALSAVSVAALTLYDMLKAASHGIVIESIQLLYKKGGKSGTWQASSMPAH